MVSLISGPCSAESEEQVLQTASSLKALAYPPGIRLAAFRAGLWKPRTRPGGFEGVGSKGLPWLERVRRELGLAVAVEVATAAHLEECLRHGIDAVWIGARTSADPFAVQALSDVLKGVDIPVYVKNPVNPDPELWIGAIERIRSSSRGRVTAVHRGFSQYEKGRYRNAPKWQIAIELMRRMPDVGLYCDPSHIAGDASLVKEVSQAALDLGMKGLFIECHHAPASALTDARQQVSPTQLEEILRELVPKTTSDEAIASSLVSLRSQIDSLDEELLDVLSARMAVSGRIGSIKKAGGITPLQTSRWEKVLERAVSGASARGLDPSFVRALFELIHEASLKKQE